MAVVSHNLQQRGAAEAVDVKFAVEQRMVAAVMLLQEVRAIGQEAKACCLAMNFTQTLIWTLLLPYRGILHVTFVKKSYQEDTLLSFCLALSGVRSLFLVMGMSLKMTCGPC